MNEIKKGNRWDNRGQISKIKTKKCQKPANDSPRDVGEVGWKSAIQNWIHFYCEKNNNTTVRTKTANTETFQIMRRGGDIHEENEMREKEQRGKWDKNRIFRGK